jgi:hypothetical protein
MLRSSCALNTNGPPPLRVRCASLLVLLLLAAGMSRGDVELRVEPESSDLRDALELGAVEIADVGRVVLHARRHGRRIVIRAVGPDDVVLGRGETVVGLAETPVVIGTPHGYETIHVRWGAASDGKSEPMILLESQP